jgi:tRNA pseudouridine55 synthase
MASGLVLIDKPAGITSFDVVAKLRKILNTRKIGHAGTLDPMATGLMLLGVNQGTKLLQFLIGMDKQYVATIRLGAATVSDDSQGEIVATADASGITAAAIDAEIQKLTGEILQLPSSVSAKKIDGKRAYDLVREGKSVELKPKAVVVSRFERTSEPVVVGETIDFDVIVDCGSGTYIRALARDIGNALGVFGHLTSLRRTKIGEYQIAKAFALEAGLVLTPLSESVLQFAPGFEISAQQALDVRNGKPLKLESDQNRLSLSCGSDLVAISNLRDGLFRSEVVFASEQ